MRTNTPNRHCGATRNRTRESGFSMVEMCIAMVIIFIGLVGASAAISYSLMASNRGRGVTNSKLLVISILEQMETLRNSRQLTFLQIANTDDVDNKGANFEFEGFPTDPLPVSTEPGPDGIFGTVDDTTSTGDDGVYGTSDDVENDPKITRDGYTREITITTLSSNIKKITVKITYPGPAGDMQSVEASSYLNNDSQANYVN